MNPHYFIWAWSEHYNLLSHGSEKFPRQQGNLRPLQFNDLYENAGLWDSKSRTWEQTFEIDKRQLQRFGVHKIIRFLFSRPRAFETYNLSKFHWLSTLVGFSLLFEQHSLFLFQKTRMLQDMKKAVWNLSFQSLKSR